jgi:DNA-binding Lrp family transcriptional regulator
MDEKDFQIYQILQKDGRAKLTEIARKLGLTHPSVKERLDKLLRKREIAVKALLNIKELNFKSAVVNLQVESMEHAMKLADMFASCPRIAFVVVTTGKYNLSMVIIAESTSLLESTVENSIRPLKNVLSMEVSIGEAPVYPTFMEVKVSPNRETAPCGKRCPECYLYERKCLGCPATVYYKGMGR